MAKIWEKVSELLDQGQGVRITLHPGQEIRQPKNLGPGRPRVRDPQNPYAHWSTPQQGYARPRCPACKKRLKIDDVIVCSEGCRQVAIRFHQMQLAQLQKLQVRIPITKAAAEELRRLDS